jgi:hypothetical protein
MCRVSGSTLEELTTVLEGRCALQRSAAACLLANKLLGGATDGA